jgi:hypothetical protein
VTRTALSIALPFRSNSGMQHEYPSTTTSTVRVDRSIPTVPAPLYSNSGRYLEPQCTIRCPVNHDETVSFMLKQKLGCLATCTMLSDGFAIVQSRAISAEDESLRTLCIVETT